MKKWCLFPILMIAFVVVLGCGGPKPSTSTVVQEPPAPVKAEEPAAEAVDVEVVGEEEVEPEPVEKEEQVIAPEAAVQTDESGTPGEPAVVGGVPKLVVDEPEWDFGERDDSETVEHKFVLRNEGTGVLKIENVRASCGCTTTDLEKNELAPGEEIKIGAATNLRGRQGPQTKVVTVFSNDPTNPSFRLTIKGVAIATIMVDPMNVQFGRIDDDEPREAVVTIKSTKEDVAFNLQSAELADMDFIEHEIKEIEEGRVWELHVRTKGELPVGNHSSRFIIRTDSRERAVIWLPVSLQVIGPLQVMPPVINIRFSEDPEEVEQQQLSITAGRVSEFEITEVILPLDSMEYELIPAGANAYRLRLSNMPRTDALEEKKIVLHTNIPDHPEVEIPFSIYRPRLRQVSGMPAAPPTPNVPAALRGRQRPPAGVEDVADAPVVKE